MFIQNFIDLGDINRNELKANLDQLQPNPFNPLPPYLMTNTIKLTPLNAKSFYNKCKVVETEEMATLTSYKTKVATYNFESKKAVIFGRYSQTTARHINAFLVNYGISTMTKKEMETYATAVQTLLTPYHPTP